MSRGRALFGANDSDLPPPPDINYEFDFDQDTAFLEEDESASHSISSSVGDNLTHTHNAPSFDYYLHPNHNGKSAHLQSPEVTGDEVAPSTAKPFKHGEPTTVLLSENTKLKTENEEYAHRVGELENQNNRIRTVITQMRTEMERLQGSSRSVNRNSENADDIRTQKQPNQRAGSRQEYEELLVQKVSEQKAREYIACCFGSFTYNGEVCPAQYYDHTKEALEDKLHQVSAQNEDANQHEIKAQKPAIPSALPTLFHTLRNAHIPTTLVETDSEVILLRQQVHDLDVALARTRGELLAARSECQEYESRMSAIDSELVTCKFALRQKQTHLQNAHRQVALVQSQSDSYYRDLIESREIAKVYENQIYSLQAELALAQSESRRAISPGYSEKRSVEQDFTYLLRDDLMEIHRLKEENKVLRGKVQEAARDLQRLLQEKEKLMDISNMLRSEISHARENYEAVIATRDSVPQQVDPTLIDNYENRLAEMEILIHKLELQNKTLKKELHEHRKNAAANDTKIVDKVEDKLLEAVGHQVTTVPRGGYPVHISEKTTQSQKVISDKQASRKAKLLEQRNAIGLQIKTKQKPP